MYIDYLACLSNKLSDIFIDRKYLEKSSNELLGIGISYLSNGIIFVSWFHKEHKFYFHIIMSFTDVGILFLKRFCYLRTSLK